MTQFTLEQAESRNGSKGKIMDPLKPLIFFEGKYTAADLKEFKEANRILEEKDIYLPQIKESFEIENPSYTKPDLEKKVQDFVQNIAPDDLQVKGNWIYFPWNCRFVHTVDEDKYFALRTNRNKNLITEAEQLKLSNSCIAIAGLSVGSNIASTLMYAGIGGVIRLADFDVLETTNLNRIRARIDQIGQRKIDIIAQQMYEINPYINLDFFSEGINKKILNEFVLREPKPSLIFEIIDSFEMKIYLRQLAKKLKIPVIMITNLGDRVLIDVERYDIDEDVLFFNGRASRVPGDILNRPDVTDAEKHKYAVELAGIQHIPQRALDSVTQIGKTLVGRPQLVSTVTLATSMCVYLARKIILDEIIQSCSWLLDFDSFFQEANAIK